MASRHCSSYPPEMRNTSTDIYEVMGENADRYILRSTILECIFQNDGNGLSILREAWRSPRTITSSTFERQIQRIEDLKENIKNFAERFKAIRQRTTHFRKMAPVSRKQRRRGKQHHGRLDLCLNKSRNVEIAGASWLPITDSNQYAASSFYALSTRKSEPIRSPVMCIME
jgi:hypothetical protein